MKVKVAEATNLQLDWMVAKAEGKNGILHDDGITRCIVVAAPSGVYKGTFTPTINWSQGGPIIERELISVLDANGCWAGRKTYWDNSKPSCELYGQTPLLAAMRCFVTSKLGEEVEVPEELK